MKRQRSKDADLLDLENLPDPNTIHVDTDRSNAVLQVSRQVIVADTVIRVGYHESVKKKKHRIRASIFNDQNNSLLQTEDRIMYSVEFVPPIPQHPYLLHGIIEVHLVGYNNQLLTWTILPNDEQSITTDAVGGEHYYRIYPTHQLKCCLDDDSISTIYFTLQNEALYRPAKATIPTVRLALVIDLEPLFFKPLFGNRYHGLSFVPPDISVETALSLYAPENIPQKIPIWQDLRGRISGSKMPKLIGYNIPTKPPYDFFEPEERTPFVRARIMFGVMYEDLALALYLHAQSNVEYFEKGSFQMDFDELPRDWTASPDGLLVDHSMSLAQIPGKERAFLLEDPDKWNNNVQRGILEIKCSNASKVELTAARGYHLVQVYAEMMAAKVAWGDIMLLHRSNRYNKKTKVWEKIYTASFARVYRHLRCEQLLVKCLLEAYENIDTLQDVVKKPHFVKLREYFDTLAKDHLIHIPIDIDQDIIAKYHKCRKLSSKAVVVYDDDSHHQSFFHQHANVWDIVRSKINAIEVMTSREDKVEAIVDLQQDIGQILAQL